jgi:hypothetical protein
VPIAAAVECHANQGRIGTLVAERVGYQPELGGPLARSNTVWPLMPVTRTASRCAWLTTMHRLTVIAPGAFRLAPGSVAGISYGADSWSAAAAWGDLWDRAKSWSNYIARGPARIRGPPRDLCRTARSGKT